ncbi:MAG: demethylmenaquinone methyltransferase [Clostridia bacterium]|jgi:demethylmenaquinone methyltransferase/2-methoxy-6-polyprenyl-1,4-benzoquinol methylase|nr:demethylmenaquinone methyltransferase [Clostridia bacterium]
MDKEQRVHSVFENISQDYDKMNDIISFGHHRKWKMEMIQDISTQNPAKVLDLCCGTGDISLALAEMNPKAKITGADFSANMLKVAKERQKKAELNNIEFTEGNAMALTFADNTFDCAVISFGLRNVADYSKVLSEMRRVIKAGSPVYCLDSSYPHSPLIKPFFKLYFKYIMPFFGNIFSKHKNEYQWLNESTEAFLSKPALAALMRKVGLKNVKYKAYLFGSAARHVGYK